jgi:hypothetical protein
MESTWVIWDLLLVTYIGFIGTNFWSYQNILQHFSNRNISIGNISGGLYEKK